MAPRDRLLRWIADSARDGRAQRYGVPFAIFSVSLVLRVAYLWGASSGPFFESGGVDSSTYMQRAFEGLGSNWPGEFAFDQPPLYPLWLAAIGEIFGQTPWALKLVQSVIGSITCVLVYFIGRSVFRDLATATLAAALCAAHGTLIYFDGQIVSASLETFLMCLALLALTRAGATDRRFWWTLAGIAIGLSTINRGAILLSVPLVLLWIHGCTAQGRAQATRMLLVLLPIGACLLPVATHNFRFDASRSAPPVSGIKTAAPPAKGSFERVLDRDFALITSRVGMNLYLGNAPEHYAKNDPNHPLCFGHTNRVMKLPWRSTGDRTASGQQRHLLSLTQETIADDPVAWLRLTGRKILELVNGAEIPRNANLYADRQYSAVLSALLWRAGIAFPAGLLIPLALLGLLMDRANWRERFLLLSFLLPRALFVVSFFVAARMRVPTVPILALYASFALVGGVRRLRDGGMHAIAGPAAALVALTIVCNLPLVPSHEQHGAYEYFNLGNHLRKRGALSIALPHYRKAVETDPSSATANYLLGFGLDRLDRSEDGLRYLEAAIALDPRFVEVSILLGKIHRRAGRIDKAREHFRRALEVDPDNAGVQRLLDDLRSQNGPAGPRTR